MTLNEKINAMSVDEKAKAMCEAFVDGYETFTQSAKKACFNEVKAWLESEVIDD